MENPGDYHIQIQDPQNDIIYIHWLAGDSDHTEEGVYGDNFYGYKVVLK
jgi:hypothetical protein